MLRSIEAHPWFNDLVASFMRFDSLLGPNRNPTGQDNRFKCFVLRPIEAHPWFDDLVASFMRFNSLLGANHNPTGQ